MGLRPHPRNHAGFLLPTRLSPPGVTWGCAESAATVCLPGTNAGGSARLSTRRKADTTVSAKGPGRYRVATALGRLRRTLVVRVRPALLKRSIPVTESVLRAPSPRRPVSSAFGTGCGPAGRGEAVVRDTAVPRYPGAHPVAAAMDHYPAPYSGSRYPLAAPARTFEVDASPPAVAHRQRSAFGVPGHPPDGQGPWSLPCRLPVGGLWR